MSLRSLTVKIRQEKRYMTGTTMPAKTSNPDIDPVRLPDGSYIVELLNDGFGTKVAKAYWTPPIITSDVVAGANRDRKTKAMTYTINGSETTFELFVILAVLWIRLELCEKM